MREIGEQVAAQPIFLMAFSPITLRKFTKNSAPVGGLTF